MIVTIDEYENLRKYGTISSYALDGFDDLWSSTDSQDKSPTREIPRQQHD